MIKIIIKNKKDNNIKSDHLPLYNKIKSILILNNYRFWQKSPFSA